MDLIFFLNLKEIKNLLVFSLKPMWLEYRMKWHFLLLLQFLCFLYLNILSLVLDKGWRGWRGRVLQAHSASIISMQVRGPPGGLPPPPFWVSSSSSFHNIIYLLSFDKERKILLPCASHLPAYRCQISFTSREGRLGVFSFYLFRTTWASVSVKILKYPK